MKIADSQRAEKTNSERSKAEDTGLLSWKCSRRDVLAALGAISLFDLTARLAQAKSKRPPMETAALPKTALAAGRSVVPIQEELFALHDIHLLDGPVRDGQERNRRYLLRLEPDRLLSWFRREAGLDPKAPPYRGWESEAPLLPGHILGFYLSGASMMLQATGDAQLRKNLNYIIDQLADVQTANGSGYMLAVPQGKQVFAEIAAGHIDIGGLPWTGYQINGHFEPTYTLNKLMLGMYQVHLATGSPKAKQVLVRLADWFGAAVLDKLDDTQVQTLLDCEHGSLNESFADVAVLTGDQKYLAWARRLCHERMLAPLASGNGDFLTQYHANTQIPKFTGFQRIYTLTGETKLAAAAVNFWEEVVHRRTWVIGGNSANEHFFAPDKFSQAIHAAAGPESCNTVNMLRLTESLYPAHPSARLMDYYERALFNHLLAAHDPERGMFVYYTTMQPGGYRVYSDEFDSMWCCVGTGLEAPGKYGQMIYTHAPEESSLSVHLFIASRLTWKARSVTVTQSTRFPEETATTLTLTCDAPRTDFTLRVRHPWWIPEGKLTLTVNGKSARTKAPTKPGEYAEVHRVWRTGDTVRVDLPLRVTAEPLPGDDHYFALLYGPIVLSGTLGRHGLTKPDFWGIDGTVADKPFPESDVPTFLAETPQEVAGRVQPIAGAPLAFQATGLTGPGQAALIPFYQNHFQRYAVYWSRLSAQEWQARQQQQAEEARRRAALEVRTLDRISIGSTADETAHHLQGERTQTGPGAYGQHMDSHWRDARDGGWFAYDLKVSPEAPVVLYCRYWGREQGNRVFDVILEGRTLTTITLKDTGKDDFTEVFLPVPTELTRGKTSVSVKFQAHPGSTAGGLFDLRTLSPEPIEKVRPKENA